MRRTDGLCVRHELWVPVHHRRRALRRQTQLSEGQVWPVFTRCWLRALSQRSSASVTSQTLNTCSPYWPRAVAAAVPLCAQHWPKYTVTSPGQAWRHRQHPAPRGWCAAEMQQALRGVMQPLLDSAPRQRPAGGPLVASGTGPVVARHTRRWLAVLFQWLAAGTAARHGTAPHYLTATSSRLTAQTAAYSSHRVQY